jgi:predicted MFS family arabinose efflux permease
MNQPSRGLVPGLAITETVSWGVLYYAFPVLLPAMERDLGWSRTTLIGAYTAAVVVAGLAALPVGRLLDHHPPRALMAGGSALAVLAVAGWAAASSIGAFYAAWVAAGVAMAVVLYEPAQVVLVKQYGRRATQAITTLTLVAGFASTIFQPLTALLADRVGWRTALVVLAGGLAVITIPIHLNVLPRGTDVEPVAPPPATVVHPDRAVRPLTVAFTLAMAAKAAGTVHLIPYLVDRGWTAIAASLAAGTLGATQVAARVAFVPAARRIDPRRLTAAILGLPAAGVTILAASGGDRTAWIAVVVLGVAQGTTTLLRPMLLNLLHGPHGYGRVAATSAATTTIARAIAPLALAAIAASVGYLAGLMMFASLSVMAAFVGACALRPGASSASCPRDDRSTRPAPLVAREPQMTAR